MAYPTDRHFVNAETGDGHLQLVVPGVYCNEILQELHGGIVGGHLGQDKTLSHLKEFFTGQGTGVMLISVALLVLHVHREKLPLLR